MRNLEQKQSTTRKWENQGEERRNTNKNKKGEDLRAVLENKKKKINKTKKKRKNHDVEINEAKKINERGKNEQSIHKTRRMRKEKNKKELDTQDDEEK